MATISQATEKDRAKKLFDELEWAWTALVRPGKKWFVDKITQACNDARLDEHKLVCDDCDSDGTCARRKKLEEGK